MKKVIILLTAIILILTSCQDQQSDIMTEREQEIASRTIAGVVGYTDDHMIEWVIPVHDIKAVTDYATQIVICRIENLENVKLGYLIPQLNFQYNVVIEDIYKDISGSLGAGDTITVYSVKGIITGNDYKKIANKASSRTKAASHVREILNSDYEENEYIISTSFDSIPFEVGKTYIMYLNGYDGNYSESGFEFAYEYNETGGILYYGIDYKRMDIDIDELKQQILNDISGGEVIEQK